MYVEKVYKGGFFCYIRFQLDRDWHGYTSNNLRYIWFNGSVKLETVILLFLNDDTRSLRYDLKYLQNIVHEQFGSSSNNILIRFYFIFVI